MNNLKFRIWDKRKKKMLYPASYVGGITALIALENIPDPKSSVVMQYTGFKDTMGKEIYNGDILEHAKKEYYKVVWNEDGLWWVESSDNSDILWRWAKVCKVVGNIYQNPELLK